MSATIIGFGVQIVNSGDGKLAEPGKIDLTWDAWYGGGVKNDACDSPGATVRGILPKASGLGTQDIGDITLRGPMTVGRSELQEWVNETVRAGMLPSPPAGTINPRPPRIPPSVEIDPGSIDPTINEGVRKVLEAKRGARVLRDVIITERVVDATGVIGVGRRFFYYDCWIAAYHFPRMSVTNTTGNVIEEVRIKPKRVELK